MSTLKERTMRANDNGKIGLLTKGLKQIHLLTLFVVLNGVLSFWSANHSNCLNIKSSFRPSDLWLRHNEICCSHEGVNPFDIWNRAVVHPVYKGHEHPPYPDDNALAKLTVHAYPPWHTAFMWWMGDISYPRAVSALFFAFGVAACGLFVFIKRMQPQEWGARFFYWSLCVGMMITPLYFCLIYGNYGLIITALMIVLFASMERQGIGWDCLGGVALALMMVKPQMGALFAIPVLFSRRLVLLGVSVLICLGATAWTAMVYQQSLVDLLLQVPQIGEPWVHPRFWPPLKVCHYPILIQRIEMFLSIVLCCVGCYWTRGIKEKWIASVPAVLLFPVWTYSNIYDHIGGVFVWILVASLLTGTIGTVNVRLKHRMTCVLLCVVLLSIAKSLLVGFGNSLSQPVLFQVKQISLYLLIIWCCC